MKLYHTLFVSLILFAPSRGFAAGSDLAPISLGEVTRAVLKDNPSIKSALSKWNAMKARIPQASAWEDPKVSFQQKLDRFVSVQPDAFSDQMVSVEQMIPLSGKNRSQARIAAAEAVRAFEAARRQELDVLGRARASYFRLLNVYAQIGLNERSIASLKEIAGNLGSKHETGGANAGDAIAAGIEADKLIEARGDLETALAAEQSQLNVLMNRDAFFPLGKPVETDIKPGELAIDKLRNITLAERPEIKMAVAGVELEKAKLQLAHRGWIPDPAVTVQAQRYNEASQAVSEIDAGISFGLPWVNPGKHNAEVREADAGLAAAQQELEGTRNEAMGRLRDALQKVETAHHHLALYRDRLLPEARRALQARQLAYESGKTAFPEWIASQRTLQDIEAMDRQNLAQYQAALAELETVTGADLKIFPHLITPERQNP